VRNSAEVAESKGAASSAERVFAGKSEGCRSAESGNRGGAGRASRMLLGAILGPVVTEDLAGGCRLFAKASG
jgi:hypothetical protein